VSGHEVSHILSYFGLQGLRSSQILAEVVELPTLLFRDGYVAIMMAEFLLDGFVAIIVVPFR
jgi:hypothetical protein